VGVIPAGMHAHTHLIVFTDIITSVTDARRVNNCGLKLCHVACRYIVLLLTTWFTSKAVLIL